MSSSSIRASRLGTSKIPPERGQALLDRGTAVPELAELDRHRRLTVAAFAREANRTVQLLERPQQLALSSEHPPRLGRRALVIVPEQVENAVGE